MDTDTFYTVARSVARRYKRQCWWAEEAEMVAIAVSEMVKGYPNYNPHAASLRQWCWGVSARAMMRYLVRNSSITSGHQHAGTASVKGLRRAPIADAVTGEEVLVGIARPDRAYQDAERQARIRRRVVEVLGSEASANFAMGLWGDGFTVAEIAKAHGMRQGDVRDIAQRVQYALAQDEELRALWHAQESGDEQGGECECGAGEGGRAVSGSA